MTQTASPREVREPPFARRRGRRHDADHSAWDQELERPAAQPRAAVDGQHFAGDVAGVLGDQERDRVRDFFRPAPPLQRHGCGDAIDGLRRSPRVVSRRPAIRSAPGATALTRMRWRAHSTASVCVIDITPAFAAAEWMVPALPVQT